MKQGNKSEIEIAVAAQRDAALVADMSRICFRQTFAPFNSRLNMDKFMETDFARDRLISEFNDPGNIFLLAKVDGEALGYAKIRESNNAAIPSTERPIELARIYVLQEAISKGIGKALMNEVVSIARRMDKTILWLGVWEKNERAILFYEKLGFHKFDEHIFMLGDDAQIDWLLHKKI